MRPKAIGAWNLHELTKALPSVEQFVLFSSVVSWVGHQGASSTTRPSSLWHAPRPVNYGLSSVVDRGNYSERSHRKIPA